MKTIITHGGPAHRDDLLSVAIALATEEGIECVCRRELTTAELGDPEILVLDVGGEHSPAMNNFDHHQLGRDDAPACALSLYLGARGLLKSFSRLEWFAPTVEIDARGPFAWAKTAKMGSFPFELLSPVEAFLLGEFSKESELRPGHALWGLLESLGCSLVRQARNLAHQIEHLRATTFSTECRGVGVLVHKNVLPAGPAATLLRKEHYPEAAIQISRDDRGPGWTLFRYDDHPAVDFSVLGGQPGVVFAHPVGFMCKTEQMPLGSALALCARAVKPAD